MPSMATWSAWFKQAEKIGYTLESILPLQIEEDQERLYSSGLPVLDRLFVDGEKYDSSSVRTFCDKHALHWARIYHKNDLSKRSYKLGMTTPDVLEFIEGIPRTLAHWNIQLFEYVPNQFGGNIVSDDSRTSIEMVHGTQGNIERSQKMIYHGEVSSTGCLHFSQKRTSRLMRVGAQNALRFLRLARGEYLKGYFEFIVSDKNQIYFLDYKTLFLEAPNMKETEWTSE